MQHYRPMSGSLLRPVVAMALAALLIEVLLPLMLAAEGAAS